MELALGIGASIAVIALALFFVRTDPRFVQSDTQAPAYRPAASAVAVVLCTAPFVAMALVPLPYGVMYLAIWIACALVTRFARGKDGWSWLTPNITAALIMLMHLIASAAFAVLSDSTLIEVAADPLERCIVLGITVALVVVLFRALQSVLNDEAGKFSGSTRMLTWFSWTVLACIAFDALSLGRGGSGIFPLFALLSGLMLGIGVVALLVSASRLGRTAHFEQEYLELAEESRAEEARAADLRHRAYTDALTGLASRRSAIETLQSLIAERRLFSAVFIDMNDLKTINDTLGHTVGDASLIRLAEALRRAYGNDAFICRIGGDEFLVVLADCGSPAAEACARKALASLARADESTPALSFCFGIVDSTESFASPDQVLERSDLIMYEHKKLYHREQGRRLSGVPKAAPCPSAGEGGAL